MPTDMPTPDVGVFVPGTADTSDLPPLCAACLRHEGLCLAHSASVLPQLAQPHWYRLVGNVLAPDNPLPDESAPVLKAKRRTERRLRRAMSGEFTRSTRAA